MRSGTVNIPGGTKGADRVLVTAEPAGGSLQPTTQPVMSPRPLNRRLATAASVADVATATQTCYRHPDRETGVSCSSCGRPICPDCMTPSPVGMRCPECAGQSTRVVPAAAVRAGGAEQPVVTYALIAICVVAFVGEMAGGAGLGFGQAGGAFVEKGALFGPSISINHEYWRLITSGFLHAGFLHIAFNMYLLWYWAACSSRRWGTSALPPSTSPRCWRDRSARCCSRPTRSRSGPPAPCSASWARP